MKALLKPFFFSCLVLSLFLSSCGSSSMSADKKGKKPSVLKFNKQTITDDKGIGGELCTFLVPENWKVDSKIDWNINNVQMPASLSLKISNEDGRAMEGFPDHVYLVSFDPQINRQYPQGSMVYAAKVIYNKPTAVELIKN